MSVLNINLNSILSATAYRVMSFDIRSRAYAHTTHIHWLPINITDSWFQNIYIHKFTNEYNNKSSRSYTILTVEMVLTIGMPFVDFDSSAGIESSLSLSPFISLYVSVNVLHSSSHVWRNRWRLKDNQNEMSASLKQRAMMTMWQSSIH